MTKVLSYTTGRDMLLASHKVDFRLLAEINQKASHFRATACERLEDLKFCLFVCLREN